MTDTANAPTLKPRILITDDDVYNRDFYKELLTDAGYQVETAANGDECIARLQSDDRYDLILLDIVMPVKDGMETLTVLQNTPYRAKHGPIYMLSALGQDTVLDNAKNLGSDGYIVKTDITPDQLIGKVKEILKTK